MDPRPVISVHVPKCGGTSSLRMFRTAYGQNAVKADYEDMGGIGDRAAWLQRRPVSLPPRIRVVHGHFHASKYDMLKVPAFRMTFLRHPIALALSVYHFVQQNAGNKRFQTMGSSAIMLGKHYTFRQMVDDPATRGSVAAYFKGWDMKCMDFVGCHERRDADIARLSKMLGVNLNAGIRDRVTAPKYDEARQSLMSDPDLMKRLREIYAEDIAFYERWTGMTPNTP